MKETIKILIVFFFFLIKTFFNWIVNQYLNALMTQKKKKKLTLYNFLFEEKGKRGQLTWERGIALWCVV